MKGTQKCSLETIINVSRKQKLCHLVMKSIAIQGDKELIL